jgi:hypothetical protein
VSKARERLADVLDEGGPERIGLIERGDAQYVITPKVAAKRTVHRRSVIETVDSAVDDGQWHWDWTRKGIRFAGGRSRS